jgi:hypothetical protein
VAGEPETGPATSPQRFAYLILTHKESPQVEALADRILELSPGGEVVVHHDLESDDLPWGGRPPARVHLLERGHVWWGDWSIVDATLRLVRFAREHLRADWFVVLSGEHWPALDLQAWEVEVATSGVDGLVEADALPHRLRFGRSNESANMYLSRCVHRWVGADQPQHLSAHRAIGALQKLSLYVTPIVTVEYSHRRRRWFFGRPRARGRMRHWVFYKGTQWIAFNSRAADEILHTDPGVTDWFRRGHIPDETYFHTVLRHAENLVITSDVVTYVPIGPVPPTERWMVLKPEHLPEVWRSGAAFARKVDLTNRPGVIRALDREVDRRRASSGGTAALPVGGPPTRTLVRAPARRVRPHAPHCVAVVGMHRSGTSATAGLLVGLGLDGPKPVDLVRASESNPRGHWESESVHMTNVRVLAALHADTYAPPLPDPGWEDDPALAPLRAEAARWFAATSLGPPLVLKDPRLCITLPLWRSALPAPLASVFVVRDPLEVARSLETRDALPIVLGLALWDRYVRAAVRSLQGSPTLVVDYAALMDDPVKWTELVCEYLEGLGIDIAPHARTDASEFLDVDLRHHQPDDMVDEPLAGPARDVHALVVGHVGIHSAWQPPDLPPAPPWADYLLDLRREVVAARHELYWTQSSRAVRSANALWRLTGRGPRPSPGPLPSEAGD